MENKQEKEIPKEILQMADYLAFKFSESMHSPTDSKEDLKHDLIIEYLEKVDNTTIKDFGGWFTHFKFILLNKYRVLKNRDSIMKEYFKQQEQKEDCES